MSKLPLKVKKTIISYLNEINSLCPIEKAFLFGSWARQRGSIDSDIDLAIFSKAANDENRLEIMTRYLMKVSKYKLDLQPLVFSYEDYFDENNDFIMQEIRKKGIEIHFPEINILKT